MATQGPFTVFDWALLKMDSGVFDLDSHAFKAVLLGSAQAISRSFVGSSADCRYADLTDELTTANGYTAGGVTLTPSLTRPSASVVRWTAANWSWTPTGPGLIFKYLAIYDDTDANDLLLCFCDMDVGGTTVTSTVAPLQFTPHASGIFTRSQA